MPVTTSWERVNGVIHRIKKMLSQIVKAEKSLHIIKKALLSELDELYRIIEEQVNGEGQD